MRSVAFPMILLAGCGVDSACEQVEARLLVAARRANSAVMVGEPIVGTRGWTPLHEATFLEADEQAMEGWSLRIVDTMICIRNPRGNGDCATFASPPASSAGVCR